MSLPGGATLGIVLPFVGAIVVTLFFSTIYVRRYRNPYDSETSTIITSILSMAIALLTSALLPVDVFIVSFMKNSNGTFKEWAENITFRNNIENSVLYSYYTLYSLICFCIFIVIPFMYFYYEEKNDDGFVSEYRFCTALKFTSAFLFVAVTLLLTGAFVPLKSPPANVTEWDQKIKFLINDLAQNRGEDALSMVLSILSVIGMLNVLFFTGFGISSWPIGLIRGTKSARAQAEEIQDSHLINQTRINALRDKERFGSKLTVRERRQLSKLEDHERRISREEQHLDDYRKSVYYKLRRIIRPLEILLGCFAAALALIVWLSLLLTNIDKAMHSLGMHMGYALNKTTLPNPIDIVLVTFQKAFPLDYVFILLIAFFFVMATISGIRNLGLWFFFIKMYKLRSKKTSPQGLLLLCSTLMMTVLGINILFYCISPQYTTFGNQHYIVNTMNETNATVSYTTACSLKAIPDDCTMTRASSLLLRYFYKAWFFGAIYYWATWGFIIISALSCIYVIMRQTRSATHGLIDDDDLEGSDEEFLR